jgi:hypothetical protein
VTDRTVELDQRRGAAAQKETGLRRLRAEVEAQRAALERRQDDLERNMLASPAETWADAAEKARYLITLLAAGQVSDDPRRRTLVDNVLADFDRLLAEPERDAEAQGPNPT